MLRLVDDGGDGSYRGRVPRPARPIRCVWWSPWTNGATSCDALAGDCARVTTIINSTAGDPHDYEPTPADNVAFSKAALVVMNGLSYDHWAEDAVDTLSSKPAVVNGGDVVGTSRW